MGAEKLSLDAIRAEIKEKNANWKAARTSISELGPEEQRKRLGLLPTNEQLGQITRLGLDVEQASKSFEKSRDTEIHSRKDFLAV